jgi:hypothetical protein
MDKGFQFDVNWHDNDVLDVRVGAWNGAFGGTVDVYVAIGGLREAAETLDGFPRSAADKREVVFGQFGREWAGGAVSMRFYCADEAGHAYVESRMESDGQVAGITQSTVLVLRIEPAALDSFVEDLRRLETKKTGTASLRAS